MCKVKLINKTTLGGISRYHHTNKQSERLASKSTVNYLRWQHQHPNGIVGIVEQAVVQVIQRTPLQHKLIWGQQFLLPENITMVISITDNLNLHSKKDHESKIIKSKIYYRRKTA